MRKKTLIDEAVLQGAQVHELVCGTVSLVLQTKIGNFSVYVGLDSIEELKGAVAFAESLLLNQKKQKG
jgi:hypothetical protein